MKNAYRNLLASFSSSKFGSWFTATLIAPLDPIVYKMTGGRFTAAGPTVIPQIVLTTIGRKSGLEREVQLVHTMIDDKMHIVASNFGREKHPAWSYNLDANPEAMVQLGSEEIPVTAVRLTPEEAERAWPIIIEGLSNYGKYRERTDREIRIYRLERR